MKRIFVAINIKCLPEIEKVYDDLVFSLRNSNIRWVKKENFHITLKFIGNVDADKIESIKSQLGFICGFTSIKINFNSVGVFGKPGLPRTLWLGVDDHVELNVLYNTIESVLSSIGIEKEERSFQPHLTVGRIKKLDDINELNKLLYNYKTKLNISYSIFDVILYESRLLEEGAKYYQIKKYQLSTLFPLSS